MGGHPWWYVVPYQQNVEQAMNDLREREFRGGRYNPAVRFPSFPVTEHSAAPGAKHRTIDAAVEASNQDGTRSILDMFAVGDAPAPSTMCALPDDELIALYGTTRPTRAAVEESLEFLEDVERGEGRYVVLYDGDRPTEILFAGYSYD